MLIIKKFKKPATLATFIIVAKGTLQFKAPILWFTWILRYACIRALQMELILQHL